MQLTKAQIEAVRYQLKKLESFATYEEIRFCAETFADFDALDIAKKVCDYKTTTIDNQKDVGGLLTSDSVDNSQPTQPQPMQTSQLTIAQKQTLTTIQAQQMGLALSPLEIDKVTAMVADDISDSVGFLQGVSIAIQAFINNRNNQAQQIITEEIENIANIINTGNEELGDIFNGANQQLHNIIEQCKQRKADYKSPYIGRLESIRESLGLPQ